MTVLDVGLERSMAGNTVYLSGPMTDMPDHNFAAFDYAAQMWRGRDWSVYNPAEEFEGVTTHPRETYMRHDVENLLKCGVLAVLPGWQDSKGAQLEVAIARELGIPVVDADQPTYSLDKCVLVNEPNEPLSQPNQAVTDHFKDELARIRDLHDAKKSDYTAGNDDRLANYRFSSGMVGLTVDQGMFMRMCEKVYRIKSLYLKGGTTAVKDESMDDTLRDIAIIAILMRLARSGAY